MVELHWSSDKLISSILWQVLPQQYVLWKLCLLQFPTSSVILVGNDPLLLLLPCNRNPLSLFCAKLSAKTNIQLSGLVKCVNQVCIFWSCFFPPSPSTLCLNLLPSVSMFLLLQLSVAVLWDETQKGKFKPRRLQPLEGISNLMKTRDNMSVLLQRHNKTVGIWMSVIAFYECVSHIHSNKRPAAVHYCLFSFWTCGKLLLLLRCCGETDFHSSLLKLLSVIDTLESCCHK